MEIKPLLLVIPLFCLILISILISSLKSINVSVPKPSSNIIDNTNKENKGGDEIENWKKK